MHRLTITAAWLSLLCGALALWSFASGYRRSLELSDVPRALGPGFGESATAFFGGALVGWWLAAAGVLLLLFAQVAGPSRLLKFGLGTPALLYFLAPFFLVR